MSRCVDLDEKVTAQFYDQEHEEWTMQTVTIEFVLDSVCDEYTVLPSAHPEKCSDILDELKADDYYNYIHTGYSRFSEDDWDYLIRNAKEKEKLHERLN